MARHFPSCRPSELNRRLVDHLRDRRLDETYCDIANYDLEFDALVLPQIADPTLRARLAEELRNIRFDRQVFRQQRDIAQVELQLCEEALDQAREEHQAVLLKRGWK